MIVNGFLVSDGKYLAIPLSLHVISYSLKKLNKSSEVTGILTDE